MTSRASVWLATSTRTPPLSPRSHRASTRRSAGTPPSPSSNAAHSRSHAASRQSLRRYGEECRRSARSPPGGTHAMTGTSGTFRCLASSAAYRSACRLPTVPCTPTTIRRTPGTLTRLPNYNTGRRRKTAPRDRLPIHITSIRDRARPSYRGPNAEATKKSRRRYVSGDVEDSGAGDAEGMPAPGVGRWPAARPHEQRDVLARPRAPGRRAARVEGDRDVLHPTQIARRAHAVAGGGGPGGGGG